MIEKNGKIFVIVQRNFEFSGCDQKNAKIPAGANPAQCNKLLTSSGMQIAYVTKLAIYGVIFVQ